MPANRNKYGLSRTIPEDVKRNVRQECGFGCVCCGLAIGSYEHIDPQFSEARSHDAAKMAFLCEACHSRVTRGFWSKEKVKEARKMPWCIQEGRCHDAFDIGDNEFVVWAGANRIVNIETILKVDDTTLLAIEPPEIAGGPYRLSGEFYDENGTFLFKILRNEWFGETSNWDIECVGGKIVIKSAPGNIALQILCNPPKGIIIERMNMFYKNTQFGVKEHELRVQAYDKSTVIMLGREVIAKTAACVAFSAVSKGQHRGNPLGGGSLAVGRALQIGGGAGSFSIGSIPKPSNLPNTLKGRRLADHWGTIRIIGPPKVKPGRNQPCPCASGLKYKKCCGRPANHSS